MISPNNGKYTIDESLIDSILIGQKDKILSWINDLANCTDYTTFQLTKAKVLGAVIILADMWSAFGYSYKAEEITKRIQNIRNTHQFRDSW